MFILLQKNNHLNMLKFFVALILLTYIQCADYFRLNTRESFQKLLVGDTLVSTLGYFRATLQKSGCSLAISMFDDATQQYVAKGNFKSPNYTNDCNNLQIKEGKVVTDTNATYIEVISLSHNQSTILTIDDQGVIRLITTFIMPNRVDIVSKQVKFQDFKIQQKYIMSRSSMAVTFGDRYQVVQNNRNWKFIAEFGQLTIYYGQNPAIQSNYVYSQIIIRDSRIYDFANQTFPGILYNNITFSPRCFEPRLYLGFKPPYTFKIDPYWPIVHVYEQGRYKLIQIAYSDLPQHDFQQNKKQINYHHTYSPCPRKTFELNGDCVARCPAPYFHDIRGETGFCVLQCEQYSPINYETRVCSCVTDYEASKLDSKFIKQCPSSADPTPYGCVCRQGFYDGILTFSCVSSCPEKSIGINGLCMECPFKCSKCQRDGFNRRFLQCTSCDEGHKLKQLSGQCMKSCISYYSYSVINQVCEKCVDTNCVDCSNDPKVCLKCNIMTTLNNGVCNSSCPITAKQVYSQYFDTKCLAVSSSCFIHIDSHYKNTPFLKCDQQCFSPQIAYLDKCIQKCPVGYYVHNNKFCACEGINNMTIHDQCLNISACPITMSFDIRTHSCLSCPFGCMSCINTQCTSCNPGFFLYISPQTILCRRKSPLFPCDNQYSWQRNSVCLVKQYNQPRLQMAKCRINIPECQACIPRSEVICVLCNEGFLIYNNTCIKNCPKNMIKYQNTCILQEIQNCTIPHLESTTRSTIVKIDQIEKSQSYKHYIYRGLEPANDPVGYIPYFQKLTTLKNDGIPRQTTFFQPSWICLKCNDGYGMSDDMKKCLPCPNPCTNCYFARNNSCIKKEVDPPVPPPPPVTEGCEFFKDSETGSCIDSCNDTTKFPKFRDGQLYCQSSVQTSSRNYLKIDSAVYSQRDSTQIIVIGFNEQVQGISELQIMKKNLSFAVAQDNSGKVMQVVQTQQIPAQLQASQYFVVQGNYAEAYIINLQKHLKKIHGIKSKNYLPNKIYGVQRSQPGVIDSVQKLQNAKLSQNRIQTIPIYINHQVMITTWLAYIGYIMSIVIILLHAVFIGLQHLYKVDNLLIFCQTIFYFSFAKNFIGRLLAQYYFGWSFIHARFLPNLFDPIIPPGYYQNQAPLSYGMINLDGNYFRNAGFSLVWLLIFIGALIIIALAVFGISKIRKSKQIWYPQVAKQALIAGVQFFSMNLLFFSYSQLRYGSPGFSQNQEFYTASQVLAIITIVLYSLYTIIRLIMSPISGLYMLKRMLIPAILFASYQNLLFLIPIIFMQIFFVIGRFILESPVRKQQKIFIALEFIAFITGYLLMFLCTDAGVNTIIITIIIFCFIVYLSFDLTVIYLEFKQEYLYDDLEKQFEGQNQGKAKKIQNNEYRQTSYSGRNSKIGSEINRPSTLYSNPTIF